jgi:hypothetical protein
MTARKASRTARPPVPTETDELRMLGQWLDAVGLVWCHVRNEGRPTARNMVGIQPGVPDVLLFSPPPSCGATCRGVAVELKRESGGRTSRAQRAWAFALRECGWTVFLGCRGATKAIECLRDLGYGKV